MKSAVNLHSPTSRRGMSSEAPAWSSTPALHANRLHCASRETSLASLEKQLPREIWLHILAWLDESSLVMAERTSSGLFHLVGHVEHPAIHPACEPWISQVMLCDSLLNSPPVGCLHPPVLSRRDVVRDACAIGDLSNQYEKSLGELAASTRCLSVKVHAGLEQPVVNALCAGKGWQLAVMSVNKDIDRLSLATLDAGLKQRGVKRELHLLLSNTSCLLNYDGASHALILSRLHVFADFRGEILPLCRLLSQANRLSWLSLVVNSRQAALLIDALSKGSPSLQSLVLHRHASARVAAMLATKPLLSELHLHECTLQEGGLKLGELLRSAPALQSLAFSMVLFDAGSTEGCAQALQSCALLSISFLRCPLFMSDRHLGRNLRLKRDDPALHIELAQGLQQAACLAELHLDGSLEQGNLFILKAFGANPAARRIRIEGAHSEGLAAAIKALHIQRKQRGLHPVEVNCALQFRSAQTQTEEREY